MIKNILHFLFRASMILFGLLSIALLFISIFQKEWMEQAVEWIGNLIQTLGYWNYFIAFLSTLIESFPIIGVVVPGMNIMMLVGGFWGKFYLIETIIVASIGAMLGNYFGYFLGKRYGNHIISNYGEWIGIGKTEQRILEKQIQKNGFWYIVLGKFHGTLRAFIPFIAGASNMQEKNFWIYNSIGSILWAATINILGYYFVEHYKIILEHIGKITTILLIFFLAYIFLFKKEALKSYWEEKNAEIQEKYEKKHKL